jgi:Fe-S cluster assembly protein SufD
MNSKPELEIYADDVRCSHGSTTGQLDEDAVFYMRARGLDEFGATALLLQAFTSEVLNSVSSETLRSELELKIQSKLKQMRG